MKRTAFFALLMMFLVSSVGYTKSTPTPTMESVERSLQSVVHMTGKQHVEVLTVLQQNSMVIEKQEGDGRSRYGCSAFAIDVRKFMTAAHCIGDDMTLDGHPAFAIRVDKALDLAVLVSDYVKPALVIRAEPLVRQEEVVGLGYGYSWQFPTITHHHVMILTYCPWQECVAGTLFESGFIGGMSGGAVVDAEGQVVGVVQRGLDGQGSGIGYGVSAATILEFLSRDQSVTIEVVQQ